MVTAIGPVLAVIALLDLHYSNELIVMFKNMAVLNSGLAAITLLLIILSLWFVLMVWRGMFGYCLGMIEEICDEFSVIDSPTESKSFQKVSINTLKVIRVLHLTFALLKKWSITALAYLLFAWFSVSTNANAADEGVSGRITSATEQLNENIRALTLNDYSMNILKLIWGSALLEAQANPLSLDRITSSLSQNKMTIESTSKDLDSGLSLDWFADMKTINEATGAVVGSSISPSPNPMRPDSPMGWMLAVLGWLFVVLVVIAAVYRVLATMSMSAGDFKDNKGALTKMMTMQFASAFAAILITLPLYKGFNLFCLMFITMQVIGVAAANFFILGLFTQVMVSGADSFSAPGNSIEVFNKVAGRVVCSSALYASSGGVGQNSEVMSFTQIFEKSSGNATFDFGRCGKLIFTAEKGNIFSDLYDDYISSSPQTRMSDLIDNSTDLKKLGETVDTLFLQAVKELVADIGKIYAKSIELDMTVEALVEACKNYDSNISSINSGEEDEKKKIQQGKDQVLQSQCYSSPNNLPYEIETAQRKFENSYRAIIKYVLSQTNTESDTARTDDYRDSIVLNDASTYGIYTPGWMFYPFYSSLQVLRSRSMAGLVKYDIEEQNYQLGEATWWGLVKNEKSFEDITRAEAAGLDAYRAEKLMEALGQLSARNSASADWTTMVKNWSGKDPEGFTVTDAVNMPPEVLNAGLDADMVNWIVMGVVQMTIPDDGNLLPELANTGHWMIDAAMVGQAVAGGVKANSLKKQSASDLLKTAIKGPISWGGAAAATLMQPMMEKLMEFLSNLYWLGVATAYLVPMIPTYFMIMAIMKWIGQVIKASTITALVPLKIFNGDGNDLLAKGSAEIVMLAVVVAAFPTLITGVNFIVERIAGPLSATLQSMVFSIFTLVQSNFIIGPMSGIVLIVILVLIPIMVLLYLYSLPLYLMDSLPQLLSLNLSVGGMSNSLSEMGQISRLAKMSSLNSGGGAKGTPPKGTSPKGPSTEEDSSKGKGSNEVASNETSDSKNKNFDNHS